MANPHRNLRFDLCIAALLSILTSAPANAGGPKYVAGVSFFNPGVVGQPVRWASGQVNYFVDQGPLNSSVSNQQATAMVDAAAALWNAVPTAAVSLTDRGPLSEDVGGAGLVVSNGQIAQPADVTPGATSFPLGIVFDADGSVIDAIFGAGASESTSCQNNGVFSWLDNFNPDATIAHGMIVLNGLCAGSDDQMQMMSFELERAFGRILGLDSAQVNPGALQNGEPGGTQGWPVMQPQSGVCGNLGGACIPNPTLLRWDDIASLSRIYPVTAANLAAFPGKQLTAANTVSIQGVITFRAGTGMQGVNVVARPLDTDGNPLYRYTVTFVSGSSFNGNHGSPVTGFTDASGVRLDQWGSNSLSQQGRFDLSAIPLPPGMAKADYEVSFEPVNPQYFQASSVGPYVAGSPQPSGTLEPITLPGLSPGSAKTITVNVADSAAGAFQDALGSEDSPRILPPSGMWNGRLGQVGQTDWFLFPVRAGRTFTVVTEALDEDGNPTEVKALPSLGIWDAFYPVGSAPVGAESGLNGMASGESWLQVSASADDVVRLGVADERGDGRPDYAYQGWVLYADTVSPQRLPAAGGPIVIRGMGFRMADTVQVGGQQAVITSISPNEITAIAPAAAAGVSGSVDVEVDDLPIYFAGAVISAGLSYDSGDGDALHLNTAPMNTVPTGVPLPFTVTAYGPDMTPAGGVFVTFTVQSGSSTLACGKPACTVAASGDGRATVNVTAVGSAWSIVTASLASGASVKAEFNGGTPPTLASLSPMLSVAAGATVNWTTQALVLSNGAPLSGQSVAWQSSGAGIAAPSATAVTGANGIAVKALTVGPLTKGQQATSSACLNGSAKCVTFTALGARPEYASVQAVSGAAQSLSVAATPALITLRVLDMNGNPMAAGAVTLYQELYAWAPPCPPRGRCAQPELLATQAATATSALDGTVTFTPASLPGVATNLVGLAVTGNAGSVGIAVEQHP